MSHRVRPYWVLLFVCVFTRVEATDAPVAEKRVARAAFTTAMLNREPVDRVLVLTPPATEVYFFTDLRNLQGHTVTHRWQYKDETVADVTFAVEGRRWRVYSKKVLPPGSYGEWSVTVIDDSGWPLYVELFRYEPVDAGADHPETGVPEVSGVVPAVPLTDVPVPAGQPSE